MATSRRSIVIDNPLGPMFFPGMKIIAGRVTLDDTKTATFTFPAKSVLYAGGQIGTAAVTGAVTITNDVATVVYTAGANGELNYFIAASVNQTVSDLDAGTSNIEIIPTK